MTIKTSRAIAAVTGAALALTSFSVVPAAAAPKSTTQSQTVDANAATEFSSRKRHYRYRNNAAGAAAFAAIVGGIATYAAAREYRKAREREYQYRYGYYGAPYGYYAPRHRHWRGW